MVCVFVNILLAFRPPGSGAKVDVAPTLEILKLTEPPRHRRQETFARSQEALRPPGSGAKVDVAPSGTA